MAHAGADQAHPLRLLVADDTLMAVSVKHEPRFSAGLPQALFTAARVGIDGSQGFGYDVAANGGTDS